MVPNVPGWGTDGLNRNTMFVLADTHVFNSNLVNIARFGYMRFDGVVTQENPISCAGDRNRHAHGSGGGQLQHARIECGRVHHRRWGTSSDWSVTNSFIWQDTIALTKGRHSMRFGAEFKRHEVDENPASTGSMAT